MLAKTSFEPVQSTVNLSREVDHHPDRPRCRFLSAPLRTFVGHNVRRTGHDVRSMALSTALRARLCSRSLRSGWHKGIGRCPSLHRDHWRLSASRGVLAPTSLSQLAARPAQLRPYNWRSLSPPKNIVVTERLNSYAASLMPSNLAATPSLSMFNSWNRFAAGCRN